MFSLALATLLLIVSPIATQAESLDPFEQTSCLGETMGAEKALEILGPNWEVNLAEGNPESVVKGWARFRQILNGMKGKWYPSRNQPNPIRPFLYNSYGRLGLKIQYGDFKDNSYWLECKKEEGTDLFNCERTSKDGPLLGAAKYQAVLTDHCLRLYATNTSSGSEYEWAYLHLF